MMNTQRASNSRRGWAGARRTVETLEARHLLAGNVHDVELILGGPDEDFGLLERTIARAADLRRYTPEQLQDVREWVVVHPRLLVDPTEVVLNPENVADSGVRYDLFTATSVGVGTKASAQSSLLTTTTTSPPPTPTSTTWPPTPPAGVLADRTPVEITSDFAIWEFDPGAGSETIVAALEESVGAGSFYPLVPLERAKAFVPNDPYFVEQWHLRNTGQSGGTPGVDSNLVQAWDVARGENIVIGIVDDGVQYTHPDLAPGYRADLSRDVVDNDDDPRPGLLSEDTHGTAVAGVAAARGHNSLGVSGAAPSAQFAGIRFLTNSSSTSTDDADEQAALSHQRNNIHIYNNSWGPRRPLRGPEPMALQALQQGVASGRNGRGSVFVFAAGNGLEDNSNSNYNGYANARQAIAVSAIDHDGYQASYAEPGAPILVTAPSDSFSIFGNEFSGIVTTDLVGTDGINRTLFDGDAFPDLDYQETFGGTSSSAPLVSGIIALMLQANPNLTWRDVQHILVNTATRNDPTDCDWTTNGAGFHINHKYGFGAVDAAAAVTLATSWPGAGAQNSGSSPTIVVNRTIPDGDPVGITSSVNITEELGAIERVEVVFTASHDYSSDLTIELTSPSGTRSILAQQHPDGFFPSYTGWTFTSVRHWGESTRGTWTLTVSDDAGSDVGTWNQWRLNLYTGPAPPPVAVNDRVLTTPATAVTIPVLANDLGRLDPTSVRIPTQPANGTTSINVTTGAITYTPRAGFLGAETFTYTVAGQGGGQTSSPATVTVVVNEPPRLVNDTANVAEDDNVTINVLTNDSDLDPGGSIDATTVQIATAPQFGTAIVNANGSIRYAPRANYFGADSFTYRARDNHGVPGNPATVQITVTSVNDAPVANDETVTAVVGGVTRISVLLNDTDVDTDSGIVPTTLVIVTPPGVGSATFDPTTGEISFAAPVDFRGGDRLTYRVADLAGAFSNVATVFLERSTAPAALEDFFLVEEDTLTRLDVLDNDFDIDGFIVSTTIEVITPPMHGSVLVVPSEGLVRYTPAADYVGDDSFTYIVRDNDRLSSAPTTVVIQVQQLNDGPRLVDDVGGTSAGVDLRLDVLANDGDIDSAMDRGSVFIPGGGEPLHGRITVKPVTGEITYTPDAGYVGDDAFTYFVRDVQGATSNEGLVRVRVGEPVSLSGMVFVDLNNNGAHDPQEVGIEGVAITAVMQGGRTPFTATIMTRSDGRFAIVDSPAGGVVLPQGVYSLTQIQPAAFIDGRDSQGTPAPLALANDQFRGIALAAGQSATDFLFAERGLQAAFATAYLNRRVYLASAATQLRRLSTRTQSEPIDLTGGAYWIALDQAWDGELRVTAKEASGAAAVVRLELYDAQWRLVAQSTAAAEGAELAHVARMTGAYYLKVAGAGSQVLLDAEITPAPQGVAAHVQFASSTWSSLFRERLESAADVDVALPSSATPVLPWTGLDQIRVTFDADVTVRASDLVIRGTSGTRFVVRDFGYQPGERTATWTLAEPLAADKLVLDFGRVATPLRLGQSDVLPAQYRVHVLPADADGNGRVSIRDAVTVRNALETTAGDYCVRCDVNADGRLDPRDLWLTMTHVGTRLSTDEVSGYFTTTEPGGAASAASAVDRAIVGDEASHGAEGVPAALIGNARRQLVQPRRSLAVPAVDRAHAATEPLVIVATRRRSPARGRTSPSLETNASAARDL